MEPALKREIISVEDYLNDEQTSAAKHEYVAGDVYAMTGATVEHNRIVGNLYSALLQHLRRGPCRVFFAEVKVCLSVFGEDIFYYPDVMVGCDPRDNQRLYLRFPKLIVEVSSDSTERIDRHEKRAAYQTIETLEEYVIVSQSKPEVTVFRSSDRWAPEVVVREDLVFRSTGLELPLSTIYESITFAP